MSIKLSKGLVRGYLATLPPGRPRSFFSSTDYVDFTSLPHSILPNGYGAMSEALPTNGGLAFGNTRVNNVYVRCLYYSSIELL